MPAAEQLEERLRHIIRTISGRPDLEVTTRVPEALRARLAAEGKDADAEWFTVQEPDPHDRERVARVWVHVSPRLLDEPEDVAKGKAAHEAGHVAITRHGSFVPDEVLEQPGFHALLSSAEERPTDRVVAVRYPGAGAWLDTARRHSLAESAGERTARQALGYLPRFLQLCSAIVYEPYLADRAGLSPEVVEVLDAVGPDVAALERTLPDEGASEAEVRAAAVERYRILYTRVWPRVRALVEDDTRLEALRRLAGRGIGGLSDGQQREVEALARGERAPHELPAALRERLERELAALPAATRAELEGSARAALAAAEDAVTGERDGALDAARPESHREREVRRERERGTREGVEAGDALLRARASTSAWDDAYAAVRGLDEDLSRRLEEIFRPRAARPRLHRSGSRPDLRAVFRWEARREAGASDGDPRLFRSRRRPAARDHAVSLLVDLSGSMVHEGKIEETFRAVVLLAQALTRLGVALEVLGFQDELLPLKPFDEGLGEPARRRLEGMLREVRCDNPGGHNQALYNDDGPCLLAASQRLGEHPGEVKVLIVLSDGLPEGRHSDASDLRAAVARIVTTDQVLIGLGIGPGTGHVRDFYPASVADVAAGELPGLLAELLEDVLADPARYRPAESR
jgi:hypothetical protein